MQDAFKPLHVWVVQAGESLPCDGEEQRPMRASCLSLALVEAGHSVTIVSSDYWHQRKRHRTQSPTDGSAWKSGRIVLVPSPGYRAHVGIARLYDHWRLGHNLRASIQGIERPDVMFIGFPPIEFASEAVRLAMDWNVPCLLDVKDQWPDIFWGALPKQLRAVGRALCAPLMSKAVHAFRGATAISSMSEAFLDWGIARRGGGRRQFDAVFPFGVEPVSTDLRVESGNDVVFAGSITRSFDFSTLLQGWQRSTVANRLNSRLLFCGSGDAEAHVRSLAAGMRGVEFLGWLDRAGLRSVLGRAALGAAPYQVRPDFALSLPNKVCEYLSYGVPILAPRFGEIEQLVERRGVGSLYRAGDVGDCAVAIDRALSLGMADRAERRRRAIEGFELEFDRFKIYPRLVRHLESMARCQ